MLLTLSVISAQGAGLGSSAYRVFDAQGGTIGRVDANDWVLPDPAKFVSSHHARIRCHNNTFYLQDLSTNGTFLNSTDTPVSKSDLTVLGDGDRILIGDYEILVQLIDDGSSAAPEPVPAPPPAPAAPAAAWPIQSPAPASGGPLVPDVPPIETADPLLLLGGGAPSPARAAPLVPPAPEPPPRAPAPPPMAAPSPPAPAAGIPDDWQLTGFNIPTPAPRAAPERREPVAGPPTPPASPASLASTLPPARAPQPAPVAPPASHAATLPPSTPRPATLPIAPRASPGMPDDRIAAMFAGLGVDPDRVSPETFTELGEILRIVVQGMIDVLQSRSEVKNNFRVPMTTMRPVENNPLKFSMNVEDAIHNLFVKRNPGYLQPVDAFREGFRDVAYHQVAMLAGIRTAFNALIARFDPETLQETYERKLKRTMLLGVANKLKYWDLYCEQFEEFDKDAESTFQNLFGEEFAKAYFDQLQQLANTARLRKR
jgi:type VI secretion system FHA domain protein